MSVNESYAAKVGRIALAILLAVLVLTAVYVRMSADRVFHEGPVTRQEQTGRQP